jgi:hypothetical protein
MWDEVKRALRAFVRGQRSDGSAWEGQAAPAPSAAAFLQDVLARFPFTDDARRWLTTEITFEVRDLASVSGGGYWIPDQRKVLLFTAQFEAAIHELAHAWWHDRRIGQEDALIEATIALAEEPDPRYVRMQRLAYGYIHGIPEQRWPGMLVDRNDWEMYAGMASGMMADLRLVPPYVRRFYDGLYVLLPEDAPSPAKLAPHG